MRPTLRDFALSIILLIIGVTVAALGVTGVIRDIAAGAHKTTSVVFPVLLEAAHAGVSVVALDLTYATQYATREPNLLTNGEYAFGTKHG